MGVSINGDKCKMCLLEIIFWERSSERSLQKLNSCTFFIIKNSEVFGSATLKGPFSLSFLFVKLCTNLWQKAKLRFKRENEENLENISCQKLQELGCVNIIVFLCSGMVSGMCFNVMGVSSSVKSKFWDWRNLSPFHHTEEFINSWEVSPRDKWSAGLSADFTWRQVQLGVNCCISDTLFDTKND